MGKLADDLSMRLPTSLGALWSMKQEQRQRHTVDHWQKVFEQRQ
jgi:hypothetical protein